MNDLIFETDYKFTKQIYTNYKAFENEIMLDLYDSISLVDSILIVKSLKLIGKNEYYYILKENQKNLINFLYFDDSKIFFTHINWLIKYYYFRNIDLDFFKYEIEKTKFIAAKYLNNNANIELFNFFDFFIDNFDFLIKKIIHNLKYEEANSFEFYNHLINGDEKNILKILNSKCLNLTDFCKYYDENISKSVNLIGENWLNQTISISKEHLATSTLENSLVKYLKKFESSNVRKKQTILMTTLNNDFHTVGLTIALNMFDILGYKVLNFGANKDKKELLNAIFDLKPDFILVTATLSSNLIEVSEFFNELRKFNKNDVFRTIVAGRALEYISDPIKSLGPNFMFKNLTEFINFFK